MPVSSVTPMRIHSISTTNTGTIPVSSRLGLTWRFGKTNINFKHAKKAEVSDKL